MAWWIPPTKNAGQFLTDNWQGVLSLSRLAITPGIPKNACTFLLARSMRLVDRSRWPVLVTYADEWQGHTGGIYRAANWLDLGMTKPERVYTIGGRMTARKAGRKTRTHAEMLALGAVCRGSFAKRRFVHSTVELKPQAMACKATAQGRLTRTGERGCRKGTVGRPANPEGTGIL